MRHVEKKGGGAKHVCVNGKDRKENLNGHEKRARNTYPAELNAPPQLDAVEIEVAVGPQWEIDHVVYDRL